MIRGTRDISTLNWLDAKRALTLSEAVIVPLGSTEQHGFCLPLDTDTAICMRACEDLCKKYNLYYYPIIPFGQTWSSSGHAGTVRRIAGAHPSVVVDPAAIAALHLFHAFSRDS